MTGKKTVDEKVLGKLRLATSKAFHNSGRGNKIRFDPADPVECRRAAILIAFDGNFPEAFELAKNVMPKGKEEYLLRLIAATRRSLAPFEHEQSRNLNPFQFLLWRGYFDAARMLAKLHYNADRASRFLQIFQKTKMLEDIQAARLAMQGSIDFDILIGIAEAVKTAGLSGLEEDIARIRSPLKRYYSRGRYRLTDKIKCLIELYKLDSQSKDLKEAIKLAKRLNDQIGLRCGESVVDAWKAVVSVCPSQEYRQFLSAARQEDRQRKKEESRQEEEECRQYRIRVLNDPEECIELAWNRRDIGYLRRAINLVQQCEPRSERLRVLIRIHDAINSFSGVRHRRK